MTINLRRNEEATGQNDLSPPPFPVCRRTPLLILSDPLTLYLSSCALTLLGPPQGSCQCLTQARLREQLWLRTCQLHFLGCLSLQPTPPMGHTNVGSVPFPIIIVVLITHFRLTGLLPMVSGLLLEFFEEGVGANFLPVWQFPTPLSKPSGISVVFSFCIHRSFY